MKLFCTFIFSLVPFYKIALVLVRSQRLLTQYFDTVKYNKYHYYISPSNRGSVTVRHLYKADNATRARPVDGLTNGCLGETIENN